MSQEKKDKILSRNTRHYHSQIPKGSYHGYCRQKMVQMQQQMSGRINATRSRSRSFQVESSRSHYKKRPIDTAITFQQYIQQLQHEKQFHKNPIQPGFTNHVKKMQPEWHRQKQNNKMQNEQIIDSILPYYKCKLQKTQYTVRRPDFRVKQSKFRVNKNIVQSNCLLFLGHSLPLRQRI